MLQLASCSLCAKLKANHLFAGRWERGINLLIKLAWRWIKTFWTFALSFLFVHFIMCFSCFTSVVYFQWFYDVLRRNKCILFFFDKLPHCTLPDTHRQITHDALWEAGGPASLLVVPGGSAVCPSQWSYDFPEDYLASFSTYGVSSVVCLFLISHSVFFSPSTVSSSSFYFLIFSDCFPQAFPPRLPLPLSLLTVSVWIKGILMNLAFFVPPLQGRFPQKCCIYDFLLQSV